MKFNSILANARARSAIGLGLSLLFHALLLLFAVEHQPPPPARELGSSPDAPLSIRLLPPSNIDRQAASAPAMAAVRAPAKKSGHPKETARKEQTVARKKAAPSRQEKVAVTRTPSPVPAPASSSSAAVPTDMMEMLTAARDRRRAAGVPDQNDASESKPAEDDNALARENIAFSQRMQSRGHNDEGGVFQITSKGVRTAQVVFHGWDVRRRNTTRQLLEVDAGLNGDVETAIVRKVIEMIRQTRAGDFDWESRRLGRVVVLSARKQDNAELEAFLKRDFFDAYP
jgi:hypothetical protein